MPGGRDDACSRGLKAEQHALEFLRGQGLALLERNYRCRGGEIDLVMHDGDYLVFVEVRYRSNPHFGGAGASIDRGKQRRLLHAAHHYLQRHKAGDQPCRFDVVALGGRPGQPFCEWLQNAISDWE